jgi:hypothetical protein
VICAVNQLKKCINLGGDFITPFFIYSAVSYYIWYVMRKYIIDAVLQRGKYAAVLLLLRRKSL